MLITNTITLVGADAAGAAQRSFGNPRGFLEAVVIDYLAQPATTDVIIRQTLHGVNQDILTLTNKQADGFFRVRMKAVDQLGVAIAESDDTVTISKWDKVYLDGSTKVLAVIAGGNAGPIKISLIISEVP